MQVGALLGTRVAAQSSKIPIFNSPINERLVIR